MNTDPKENEEEELPEQTESLQSEADDTGDLVPKDPTKKG